MRNQGRSGEITDDTSAICQVADLTSCRVDCNRSAIFSILVKKSDHDSLCDLLMLDFNVETDLGLGIAQASLLQGMKFELRQGGNRMIRFSWAVWALRGWRGNR